jgi:hypothetical protein
MADTAAAELVRLIDKLTRQNVEPAGRVGYLRAELQQARERSGPAVPKAPPEVHPGRRGHFSARRAATVGLPGVVAAGATRAAARRP